MTCRHGYIGRERLMEKQTKMKKKPQKHNWVSTVIVTLILLIGLSLLLYPTAADYINSLEFKKSIEDYQREIAGLDDTDRRDLLNAAHAYNTELFKRTNRMEELKPAQREQYNSLLNPFDNGMMGYVEIKKISVYLPIYHGTDESVLHSGIGHLEGSSLPVGGKSVHTLLSGHSGLPSAKLFSNIDQLETGDTFALHILGDTLTYQVESITKVLPEEAGNLRIESGKDICTLMTCTPYGVNTHRLLVRGVRIETPKSDNTDTSDSANYEIPISMPLVLLVPLASLPVVLIIALLFVIRRRKSVKRQK